jgi:hypothetical protein
MVKLKSEKNNDVKEDKFLLGCFGGIPILLLGFRGQDEIFMEKRIQENGGIIVKKLNEPEIIIVKNSELISENKLLIEKYSGIIVTDKWIDECIFYMKYIPTVDFLYSKINYKKRFEDLFEKYKMSPNDLIYQELQESE